MTENKKLNKKIIGGIVALVALIAIFVGLFIAFRPKPAEGSKAITIVVVNDAKESKTYEVKTDAEYLKQAMEETEGLTFECDGTGMLMTVNGVTADWNVNQSYWALYVNDDYGQFGISEQPIYDGEAFRIEYTVSEF